MSTLFTKIIQGEIPSYKVYEDDKFFAFLSIMPLTEGHTLIVPKKESESWLDMGEDDTREIFIAAQKIATKLKRVFAVPKVAVIIAGFEVPHTHLHLIPCHSERELDFKNAQNISADELTSTLARITTDI